MIKLVTITFAFIHYITLSNKLKNRQLTLYYNILLNLIQYYSLESMSLYYHPLTCIQLLRVGQKTDLYLSLYSFLIYFFLKSLTSNLLPLVASIDFKKNETPVQTQLITKKNRVCK